MCIWCSGFSSVTKIFMHICITIDLNQVLNLSKEGRWLTNIKGGNYNGMIVSASDQFASNADDAEQDGLIKEFRQLNIANDSKLQHVPDTTQERQIIYIAGPSGSGRSTYTRKLPPAVPLTKFKKRPTKFLTRYRPETTPTKYNRKTKNETETYPGKRVPHYTVVKKSPRKAVYAL